MIVARGILGRSFPHNVVFPSQFARLLIDHQEHPEAKSLAPDNTQCKADTSALPAPSFAEARPVRSDGGSSLEQSHLIK
jgi:hypothetical protein